HRRAGTDLIPHSRFRLQVETELIGGFKRSFGRSPRMKTHVVQPPTLARLKQFSPVLDFRVWITSQGKVTAAVSAAKVDRLAVEDKFFSDCFEITQTDLHIVVLFNSGSSQPQPEHMQLRLELIPRFLFCAKRHFNFRSSAILIPC